MGGSRQANCGTGQRRQNGAVYLGAPMCFPWNAKADPQSGAWVVLCFMNWETVIAKVSPYIVKIETPSGSGTGFLCFYNDGKTLCGIATAEHVVADADRWQQPIRIHSYDFKKTRLLKEGERYIQTDKNTDSALILISPGDFEFPESLIHLRPKENLINIGNEVGWLGYPGLYEWTLCFFSGCVSARRKNGYLIDGVAINGVSGGPVIYSPDTGSDIEFVGAISAYHANRQAGGPLPGLLIAQDVAHFHDTIQMFKTFEEMRRQKAEEQAKQKQAAAESPPPRAESSSSEPNPQ